MTHLTGGSVAFADMTGTITKLMRAQAAEGKALGPSPAFMDPGTPVGIVDLNLGRIKGRSPSANGPAGSRLQQRNARQHAQAYGGPREAVDWVMDCVRFVADTVANADYHFEKPQTQPTATRTPGDPVAPPQPLWNLLQNPNPYMDYIELMELLIIDLLLVGNAYWYKFKPNGQGQPLAIYRLAPPHVEVIAKPWGVGGYYYQIPNADKLGIDAQDVIHFKLANPHDPYYGLGLIQGAGRSADLSIALTDAEASYYENGAIPSLAVETDRRIPRDVFKKIRTQLRARAQGPRNAGELLVLEAGLHLNSVAPSALDAGFAELGRLSRDRIMAWFRMSPKLLGIVDEAGGADKITDAQRLFDTKSARPLMNKLQRKISAELTAAYNLDYAIDYEYQMAPEDQARLAGSYATLPGIMIDEVRKFAGLGAHPDATVGQTTINLPGDSGGTGAPGDPTRNGHPDPNLPGEAGRPPNWDNTLAWPVRPGSSQPPRNAVGAKAGLGGPQTLDEVMARLRALQIAPEGKAEAVDTRVTGEHRPGDNLEARRVADVDLIARQFETDLAAAGSALEHELLTAVEGKALTDVLARIRKAAGWVTFKSATQTAYDKALRQALNSAVMHQADEGIVAENEIDYDSAVKRLTAAKDTGVAGALSTLRQRISTAIRGKKSEAPADIQNAIRDALNTWRTDQTSTIALTETTRAYNEGTILAAEGAGYTHVAVTDGRDHDPPCKEADGQAWTLAQARERPLEHPNCRRAFIPIEAPA